MSGAQGDVDDRFVPVRRMFDRYLAADPSYSAQLCVYLRGEPVVDLVGGHLLDAESVTGVFSVSKGVAALTVATLIDDGRLALDARVADYWPEFEDPDKDRITVRQLLSHQAGLAAVDGRFTLAEVLQSEAGARRLVGQRLGRFEQSLGLSVDRDQRGRGRARLQGGLERLPRAAHAVERLRLLAAS